MKSLQEWQYQFNENISVCQAHDMLMKILNENGFVDRRVGKPAEEYIQFLEELKQVRKMLEAICQSPQEPLNKPSLEPSVN